MSADPVLGLALRALSNAGAETVADLRREVAAWFDEGMNHVSGWYQRQAQLIIFVIGAVVAVSANVSTVHVVRDQLLTCRPQGNASHESVPNPSVNQPSNTDNCP